MVLPLLPPYPGHRSPAVKTIHVIVPFSRPEHYERTLENFRRQRFPGKILYLVENGAALGTAEREGLTGATVLASEAHPSSAKNVALEYIRRAGGGFFTTFDDDDWYGPGYLDELAGHAKSATVVGKLWHFVSFNEGVPGAEPELILSNRIYANRTAHWLTGGTISGFAEEACLYPKTPAEDVYYCKKMEDLGGTIRCLSLYHYLYRRNYAGARHTWQESREKFLAKQAGQMALEFPAKDGAVDLDLVTGARAPTEYRVVGQPRFIPVARA